MRKKDLLRKFIHNEATEEDIRELFRYFPGWDKGDLDREIRDLGQNQKVENRNSSGIVNYLFLAASILFLLGITIFYLYRTGPLQNDSEVLLSTVGSSDSTATILFGNGEVISVDSERPTYIAHGSIGDNYLPSINIQDLKYEETVFDVISTPVGTRVNFILPDSTVVNLNGNSRLKFAHNLVNGRRYVELTGEAYFDVKPNTIPFVVQASDQQVQVLGTSFNVSSYSNSDESFVALTSGKVKLRRSQNYIPVGSEELLLSPGQIGISHRNNDKLTLITEGIENYVGWRNGRLEFDNQSLKQIVRTLKNWYPVDISCTKDIQDLKFTASIRREETIQKVLDKLALTNKITYTTTERRIVIMKQ